MNKLQVERLRKRLEQAISAKIGHAPECEYNAVWRQISIARTLHEHIAKGTVGRQLAAPPIVNDGLVYTNPLDVRNFIEFPDLQRDIAEETAWHERLALKVRLEAEMERILDDAIFSDGIDVQKFLDRLNAVE